ncbi:MAG: SGNH/GDSL hydrolase family protein [Candidatus Thorarchaeota archaeon]|nr:MAG: SGNH/GDSL hydrolase family protein [Candidatus Thorarchaeota archaeon]
MSWFRSNTLPIAIAVSIQKTQVVRHRGCSEIVMRDSRARRDLTWLGLAAVLIIGLSTVVQLPIQSRLQEPAVKNIVFLGDSYTRWDQNLASVSYLTKLEPLGHPWNSRYLNIINSGEPGIPASSYAESQGETLVQSRIIDYNAHYVVIALGSNDWFYERSPEGFNTSYFGLIANILNLDETNTVEKMFLWKFPWLILPVSVPGYEDYDYEEIPAYFNVIENVSAVYDFPVIDAYSATENHTEYYIDDGVHLNHDGAAAVAEAMHETMSPYIDVEVAPKSALDYWAPFVVLVLAVLGVAVAAAFLIRRRSRA